MNHDTTTSPVTMIFEQPLNELMRVLLRLEYLLAQVKYHYAIIRNQQDSRTTIKWLIDLLNLLDRPDLKFKLNQEALRLFASLNRLQHVPGISHDTLNQTLQQLDYLINGYLSTRGKIGEKLRTHEFLTNIRQNLLSAGGDSPIDSPHYFYWLNQPIEIQQDQIKSWLDEFDDIHYTITLLLDIVRNATEPETVLAEKGFYHRTLDPQTPLQLVRIISPQPTELYPEICTGRHRISVRFMEPTVHQRPRQTPNDVPFQFACCVI